VGDEAGYGSSGLFREALSKRNLLWAVGISRRQKLIFPEATTGGRRKYHVPDDVAVSAELMLADAKWQKGSWRRGTKEKLTRQFAARRVRVADGHRHRMSDARVQTMPAISQAILNLLTRPPPPKMPPL